MAIAWVEELSQPQLQKLQAQRAKTPAKRHKQRQAELSFRYEVVHLHKKKSSRKGLREDRYRQKYQI
ncbi:hypothetical protein JYQ62_17140 [Nostoc sp. UHCC 0702]|nr:hypothetical protein JYQ62_17140 [Nostoc sp. UHCC 0702]